VKAGFGFRAAVILIGATAATAQIVLLRELLVVFQGDETSIGLILGSWLLWTAAGSSLAGRFGANAPRRFLAAVQALLAAALPGAILAVRASKGLLQTAAGEALGPGTMLLTALAVLAPLCLLVGALFTAASRVSAAGQAASAGKATGSVYLWEAVGWSAGGLAAGLALVRFFGSLEIAWWVAALSLMAAAGFAIARKTLRSCALVGLAALAAVGWLQGWPQGLERISEARLWRGFHLVATRNSVYGNLAVVGTEGSLSVYENGVVLFTTPDPAAAEEAVHYALLEHPAPRALLLIGGGLNGSIEQALRHPTLERVDYVELDPAVLDLARDYLPREWRALEADGRVHMHVLDGRLFLKTTSSDFDVIIVNLPEPRNAQLNRFYTVEFFREAARKLRDGGVLSIQLRGSEDYISPELGEYLRAIYGSLRAVFPETAAIPGETVHLFGARGPGVLARGPDELLARLRARQLGASYVSEYFIPYRMSPDRMADLDAQIGPAAPSTPLNHDFAPVAYYFHAALWSSQFSQGYRRFFRAMAGLSFGPVAAALAAALLALSAAAWPRPRRIAAFATAAMGFTSMGVEMLLLLAFQAAYGYVYQQLAVTIAAFMAGMALGSWGAMRPRRRSGMRTLALAQALAGLAALALIALFDLLEGASGAWGLAASRIAFPALALASGILGGFEFPVASAIFFGEKRAGARPSTLYALDLAGSCLSAIAFSAWLVPLFGFFKAALLLAMVSFAPAATAALAGFVKGRPEA
jgi:spermidine synthase